MCNTNKQTHLRLLNNFPEAVRNGIYTWRHDSILFTIYHYLTTLENIGFELFTYLAGFKNPEILFNGPQPAVVVKNGNKHCYRTTCCYETNFMKTRNHKIERFSKLQDLCVDKNFRVTKLYVEVSSLGVLPKDIQEFRNFCKQYDSINVKRMMKKPPEVAIRRSYFIYNRRNKGWFSKFCS